MRRIGYVLAVTLIGAIAGLVLGITGYGLAFLLNRDLGIGSVFIVTGVLAIVFFCIAIINEYFS